MQNNAENAFDENYNSFIPIKEESLLNSGKKSKNSDNLSHDSEHSDNMDKNLQRNLKQKDARSNNFISKDEYAKSIDTNKDNATNDKSLPYLKTSKRSSNKTQHNSLEETSQQNWKNSENNTKDKQVLSTADKLIVNESNHEYNVPFILSENEILECFSIIDIHKHKYITSDELTFFQDILGETATEQEIHEMVRMLDKNGTGKVFFEEFKKMALGKSQSPIGIAFPPSIRLLDKKNMNKMNRKGQMEDINNVYKDKHEVGFIYDVVHKNEDNLTSKQIKRLEKGHVNERGENKTHNEIINEFIANNNIVLIEVIRNLKGKKLREIKAANYDLFIDVVELEDNENARHIFGSLLSSNSSIIDIRQFQVNCIACMHFGNIDKSKWAFSVFDHEDSSYIQFEDIVNIQAWINQENNQNKRAVYLKKIYQEKRLNIKEPISKAQYDSIFSQFQTLFFKSISKKAKDIQEE